MQQTLFNSLQFESPYEHTSSALKIVKLDIILCISGGYENTEPLAWNSEWTNKQFSCDICFKEFTNKKSLQNHRNIHKGRTKCPVCEKVFSTTSNMGLHMRNTHGTV